MFAFGVPVPGTTNAVAAPSAKAAVNADMTPRMAVANTEMTTRTRARADLRMCQLSHSSGPTVGGTRNLPGQSSLRLSDSRFAVRRTGREWSRRFRSRPEGDPDAIPCAAAYRRIQPSTGPRDTGRGNGRIRGL